MIVGQRLLLAATLPFALLAPAASKAAPVAAPTRPVGQAALMKPLTLAKIADMDFGNLAVTANGTAVINPVTDTMTTSGGVFSLGGNPHAAMFRGVVRRNWISCRPIFTLRDGPSVRNTTLAGTCSDNPNRFVA